MKNVSKEFIKNLIMETKLLPLYTATDLSYLDTVEEVLLKNNVKLVEVTFRSSLALEAIKELSKSGELIVGAGTVRTLEEARLAVKNGAQFIVSPAIIPEVVEYCLEEKILMLPGVATPSEIQRAVSYGINTVKFFPANIYGGLKGIEALSGPFYDVDFLPTGGIDETNYIEYLDNQHVIAIGGSFILSESVIKLDDGKQADQILNGLVEKLK